MVWSAHTAGRPCCGCRGNSLADRVLPNPLSVSRFRDVDISRLPSQVELEQVVVQKHGNTNGEVTGWGPLQRSRFGYYLPGDVYEALIRRLVFPGCSWIDIGGGHDIFPDNPK